MIRLAIAKVLQNYTSMSTATVEALSLSTILSAAPLIIACAALTTALIALWKIWSDKNQIRIDKSVSIVVAMTTDPNVSRVLEDYRSLRTFFEKNEKVQRWRDLDILIITNKNREFTAYKALMEMFNFYEMISIGINNKFFDEVIIREFWRTSLVLDWLDFEHIVVDKRKEQPKIFANFERLARRWATPEERRCFQA